ncbi:hypothetical protein ACQP00_37875 [Dactylosporangium sp. CS-047395]
MALRRRGIRHTIPESTNQVARYAQRASLHRATLVLIAAVMRLP